MPRKKNPMHEAEFFESRFPGKLVGKEVLDKDSRRLGIIKSIRVEYLPWKVSLIVKGINIEIPVELSEIQNIGTVVQLKTKITAMPEINVHDLIRIREDIKEELQDTIFNPIF
ncbi:MAG: hypothetical protein EU549_00695 [Promethearchaeota archaeon]|nr:MAG: hypothetical protein EU549_00695 [Candidatus Lokiarchaeota archaeon]